MTASTTATAQWDSESATGLISHVVRTNEIFEASYPTSAISRFFSRLQGIHSTMMQTRTVDEAFSIESLYSLKEKTAVIQFLDEYSFLIPLLLEAREKIYAYFPNPELSLEVIADPEAEGHYQLLAAVSTDLTAEDAYRRLKEFDRAWWLDELGRSQGLLCISVNLQ